MYGACALLQLILNVILCLSRCTLTSQWARPYLIRGDDFWMLAATHKYRERNTLLVSLFAHKIKLLHTF